MLARDILDAGVHGGRRPDRGLAFAAVMQGKYRDRTHASPRLESGAAEGSRARMLSRMAFPVRGHLGERYKYAWSNPLLLPVAWAHRIARGLIVPPAVLWRRLQTVRSAERMSGEKLRLLTDLQVLDY